VRGWLALRNVTEQPITAQLEVSLDGQKATEESFTLAPSESATRPVDLPADLVGREADLTAQVAFDSAVSPVPAQVSARLDLRHDRPVPRLAKAEAWGDPAWQLDTAEQVFPLGRRERWEGVADQSAKVSWGWDGEFLCLMADVRDDVHANTKTASSLWDGDSFQVAVAPEGGKPFNICLAKTSEGIVLQQWQGADTPLRDAAVYSVARDDATHTTRYVLRLPLSLLGIQPAAGSRFGFGVVIFDDDAGHGHDFWMQTTSGIAGGWAPETLPRFYLAP
jgi:hypothetical protein